MKVRISDLPHTGLKVSDTLPLEALNARMSQGRSEGITFTEAPRVNLVLSKTQSGAETKGSVSTKYVQQCSRCLDPVEQNLEISANFTLHHRPAEEEMPEDIESSFTDDVGIAYFEGDHVDLEDLIQEALILELQLYWAPPCDANGDCTRCGKNRAQFELIDEPSGNALGQLFKKAGLK